MTRPNPTQPDPTRGSPYPWTPLLSAWYHSDSCVHLMSWLAVWCVVDQDTRVSSWSVILTIHCRCNSVSNDDDDDDDDDDEMKVWW